MNASRVSGWRQFWPFIRAYWYSEEKMAARLLLFGVIALTLSMVYMNVQINMWQNDFFNSLQNRNPPQFYSQLLRFVALAAIWVAMSVYSQYLTQTLQIRWRRWLTQQSLSDWLTDRAFYRMQFSGSTMDNPDQRIAEDLKLFVDGSLNLFVGLLNALVSLVSFIGILWALSGPLEFEVGTLQVTIPGYLVWVAVIYALAGNWVAHAIGKPLIGLNFNAQGSEANFRYSLVRFRDNVEGVAMYRGEADELRSFRHRFADVFSKWRAIINRQKQLAWFSSSYNQISVVVPFIVAGPRFFSGVLPLGGLMQAAGAFGYVRDALTWFINAYVAFATWKAALDRLSGFRQAISSAREEQRHAPGVSVVDGTEPNLVLDRIELDRPSGSVLVRSNKLEIAPGSRVVIHGPSGSGKSTLLLAIAALWPFGSGVIRLPHQFDALFLPQHPYFPLDTLREAVCYPTSCGLFSDAQIAETLQNVGLSHLIGRLDESANWSLTLSGADEQRVALARALLQKPKWLFLDEGMSNLDESTQARLYELLTQRLPDTTIVSTTKLAQSVGARVRRLYLRSGAEGAYELREAAVAQPT